MPKLGVHVGMLISRFYNEPQRFDELVQPIKTRGVGSVVECFEAFLDLVANVATVYLVQLLCTADLNDQRSELRWLRLILRHEYWLSKKWVVCDKMGCCVLRLTSGIEASSGIIGIESSAIFFQPK